MPLDALHARALRAVGKYGTDVSFVSETQVTHDPATETFGVPATDTVAGKALGVPGKEMEVFFVPSTYGDAMPERGAKVDWRGAERTVESIEPLEPEDRFLAAKVVLS